MPHICLLLSGAALLINGLATLGAIPRRDAAVLSLVIGGVQLLLGITYLGITHPGVTAPDADGDWELLLPASGMFLFGLTYVYVGLDFLLGLGSKGLGWFSGMVAGCGLLLAAAWFNSDPLLAVLWLCWSYLWTLFFFSLALGYGRLSPLIGWSLVLASQTTATAPALLGMTGQWSGDPAMVRGAAACIILLLLLAGGLARRDGRRDGQRDRGTAVVVPNEQLGTTGR
ncbi:AmiS/UreI family transporter [Arthrobacter sp. NPDC056727]|uniref:AmiS/UreI family transporter n=1 Tax=Arthrobacter sp. NPDC056727 TaxID=3345927 RepID=UPI00366AE972